MKLKEVDVAIVDKNKIGSWTTRCVMIQRAIISLKASETGAKLSKMKKTKIHEKKRMFRALQII